MMNAKIKFLKKGVKDSNGKYYPAYYMACTLLDGRHCIMIHARDLCKGLPKELNPANGTDITTDYFEHDHVKVFPGSEAYEILKPIARA